MPDARAGTPIYFAMVNLKTLEAFVWIVELGSFRKAAEKLHTTQPAISARIAQLEDQLKVRLFDRNQGATVPTAKGADMLVYARRMVDLHNEMLSAIGDSAVVRGTVRLGAGEVVACSWMPNLIAHMASLYRQLSLEIDLDTSPRLHVALLAGNLDMAFLDGPVKQPQIENVPLDVYPLVCVASPRLGLTRPVTLETVAPWPMITFSRTTTAYFGLSEFLDRSEQRSARIYSLSSMGLASRLVRAGVGIGILPLAALSDELASGQMELFEWPEPLPIANYTASYRKGPSARVLSAIASLASTFAGQWKSAHPRQGS
jgi:DNA-binding transcriptional LysR family regulator